MKIRRIRRFGMGRPLALLVVAAALWLLPAPAKAAVAVTVDPASISNTYDGVITLQITGLTNGEPVRVRKFLDANSNGIVDPGDPMVQAFALTDGLSAAFYDGATAVTNLNVPGDADGANGTITARLNIYSDVAQSIVGQYAFTVISPSGRFEPLTNVLSVTAFPYSQTFSGAVQCNGTNIPNAIVMVSKAGGSSGGPVAGVGTDVAGNYTIRLPAGDYGFLVFKRGYVADMAQSPTLSLGTGADVSTNLNFLLPATTSISGRFVDSVNTNRGLGGIFVYCQSASGKVAGATFTQTNGYFSIPVTADLWSVSMNSQTLATYGYLEPMNTPEANTTGGSVSNIVLAFAKGTALFYGALENHVHQPLPGISLYFNNDGSLYEGLGRTDGAGHYLATVTAGTWQSGLDVADPSLANNLFPRYSTNLVDGQAVKFDFAGLLATNTVSGVLRDSSLNPLGGVQVSAELEMSGGVYRSSDYTDTSGHFSLPAGPGLWQIGVNCFNGNGGLGAPYLCPERQSVTISNANATVNFTAVVASSQFSVYVVDNNTNPIPNVWVYAHTGSNGTNNFNSSALTDSSGHALLGVYNGTWQVGVVCAGPSGSLVQRGYFCVSDQVLSITNETKVVSFMTQPCGGLQVQTESLPNGQVNEGYSQFLQATGCGSSFAWSLAGSSGPLPSGLALEPFGQIHGTPTAPGTNSFTVQVTDGIQTDTQVLSIVIEGSVPDVFSYYVTRLKSYWQSDTGNPVPDTDGGPFQAYVGMVQSALGAVPIANVTLPGGGVRGLPRGNTSLELMSQEIFGSESALDATYPPGTYTFGLYGIRDGLRYMDLNVPAAAYPAAPRISNYPAAQSIEPSAAFTLHWDAFTGGTSNDAIAVFISTTNGTPVFTTPYPPLHPDTCLRGSATSVEIPSGFESNQLYIGTIVFFKTAAIDLESYPGAAGLAVLATRTAFPLATIPPTVLVRPTLSQPARLSATTSSFMITGTAGQPYSVEYSSTLSNWTPLYVTNAPADSFFVVDPTATNTARFYRVKALH